MSGRIRTLKPEWLDDDPLVSCSDAARVLSAGLLLLADDHGNGRASDLYLGSKVFPGKPMIKVRRALAELVRIHYVVLYDADEQRYFSIRNWAKHQRVNHPGQPRVPLPSVALKKAAREPKEALSKTKESLSPDLLTGSPNWRGSESAAEMHDPIAERSPEEKKAALSLERFYIESRGLGLARLPPAERVALNELIVAAKDPKAAITHYLADKREFYDKRKWPIRLLLDNLGEHAGGAAAAPKRRTFADRTPEEQAARDAELAELQRIADQELAQHDNHTEPQGNHNEL